MVTEIKKSRMIRSDKSSDYSSGIGFKGDYAGTIEKISKVYKKYFDAIRNANESLWIMKTVDNKEISMDIPVRLQGAAPGVLNSGGVLRLNKRKLRVRALPGDLPDVIIADISKLRLGNKLYTSELPAEKYSILHPDNTVVCQVRTSRTSVADTGDDEDSDDSSTAAEGKAPAAAAEANAEN